MRGARTADNPAPHLLAALDQVRGVVVAQRRVADKSNEIPALPELLAPLDLDGALITADATAHPDRHRRVDHLPGRPLPADGQGQPARSAPDAQGPALEGRPGPVHPRRLPRAAGAAHPQGRPGPPVGGLPRRRPGDPGSGAPAPSTSAAAARRRPPRSSTRFCSLPVDQARPEQIAAWTRGHWAIENRLHWIGDMVTGEDRHQLRTRNGPQIMAALRNPATRPHPPRPRTPHTHHHHHQIPGPTPPTSHQTTHPTTPLNQPCRPPATSTENLRVTARVVSRRPASRILHPRSRAGTMDPGADASRQDPAPAESGRCIDSQA